MNFRRQFSLSKQSEPLSYIQNKFNERGFWVKTNYSDELNLEVLQSSNIKAFSVKFGSNPHKNI